MKRSSLFSLIILLFFGLAASAYAAPCATACPCPTASAATPAPAAQYYSPMRPVHWPALDTITSANIMHMPKRYANGAPFESKPLASHPIWALRYAGHMPTAQHPAMRPNPAMIGQPEGQFQRQPVPMPAQQYQQQPMPQSRILPLPSDMPPAPQPMVQAPAMQAPMGQMPWQQYQPAVTVSVAPY